MRIASALLCAALTVSSSRAEPLSSADREALIESLEKLSESAEAKVDARFRLAISAYREAMASNEAVIEFYLKCIEKVNFQDQQKKAIDFREWKRKEEEQLSDPGFHLALRYQLRWLVITLQSASEKADRAETADSAIGLVNSVFLDAQKLRAQDQVLGQAVTASVFAAAYEINGLKKDDWPLSPVDLEQIYEKIILPPLRNPDRLDSLRNAWIRRIQQQGIKVELLGQKRVARKKNGQGQDQKQETDDNSELANFTAETLPAMQWDMEMDLFKNGDESGAAKRMLDHITNHITHKSARKWSDQLKSLLAPPAVTVPTAAEEGPSGA